MPMISVRCIYYFSILFFLTFSFRGLAQDQDKDLKEKVTYSYLPLKNSFYVEFFGNSGNLYSLNYDRSFFAKKLKTLNFSRYVIRAGVNYFDNKYCLPLMILFDTGDEHFFEAGAGWVPCLEQGKKMDGVAFFLGYRYQPEHGGLMARAGFSPTYMMQGNDHWNMIIGVSFGYCF